MSNYEVISIHKQRDNYEFSIKDLTSNEIYSVFFMKIKKTIDKINEFKNTQKNIKIVNDKLIDLKYEEVLVSKIPEQIQNEDLYITLLKTDGYLIRYFDESDITYKMCLEAIKEQAFAIRHVPKKFITDELIDTAISINGTSIMYIDKSKRTDKRCLIAYNSNPKALRFVPPYLITYKMCFDAVIKDMFCLQYVPDEYFIKVYQEAIVDRGLQIPRKGIKGVPITTIEQFKDIRNRIDRLSKSINTNITNENNIDVFETIEDRYKWLIDK